MGFLWQIPDAHVFPELCRTHEIPVYSGQDAQQGGLSGAVFTYNPDLCTVIETKTDVLEDRLVVIKLGYVLRSEYKLWRHDKTSLLSMDYTIGILIFMMRENNAEFLF
jgi:hypothetical protein